jgi:Lectin C-type domain
MTLAYTIEPEDTYWAYWYNNKNDYKTTWQAPNFIIGKDIKADSALSISASGTLAGQNNSLYDAIGDYSNAAGVIFTKQTNKGVINLVELNLPDGTKLGTYASFGAVLIGNPELGWRPIFSTTSAEGLGGALIDKLSANISSLNEFFDQQLPIGTKIFITYNDVDQSNPGKYILSINENTPTTTFPTYILSSPSASVSEGDNATFTLSTTNVKSGTTVPYVISGLAAADIANGTVTGSILISSAGLGTISIPISADQVTEGIETLTVTACGKSASVKILDTSISATNLIVSDQVNGRYYQYVGSDSYPERILKITNQFSQAISTAESASYRGLKGYLATITSANENQIVANLVGERVAYIGGTDRDSAGDWRWISGPEAGQSVNVANGFTNWYPGEPSNNRFVGTTWGAGIENALAISNSSAIWRGRWWDTGEWYSPETVDTGYVVEYGGLPASVRIAPSSLAVNEGENLSIDFFTSNIEWGKSIDYTISGISSSDISGAALAGSLEVVPSDLDGKSTLQLKISADKFSEDTETLTVNAGGKSVSVQIRDASKQSSTTTYSVSPSASSVNEGSIAKFTVSAEGVIAGTTVAYILSGLSAEDITSGEVSGSLVLDTLGMGTISVPIAADNKTEGSESLTVTVGSTTSTITVNDASKSASQYYISASDGIVDEQGCHFYDKRRGCQTRHKNTLHDFGFGHYRKRHCERQALRQRCRGSGQFRNNHDSDCR